MTQLVIAQEFVLPRVVIMVVELIVAREPKSALEDIAELKLILALLVVMFLTFILIGIPTFVPAVPVIML